MLSITPHPLTSPTCSMRAMGLGFMRAVCADSAVKVQTQSTEQKHIRAPEFLSENLRPVQEVNRAVFPRRGVTPDSDRLAPAHGTVMKGRDSGVDNRFISGIVRPSPATVPEVLCHLEEIQTGSQFPPQGIDRSLDRV